MVEKITLEVSGQKLHGQFFSPDESRNDRLAVLFIHGWTSSFVGYVEYAEALASRGVASMIFDLRSHGTSEGDINTLTRQDFIDDVVAAYDYVAVKGHSNIAVVGSSFGSYLTCLLTSMRKVSNIILRVPANYPNEGLQEPQVKQSGQVELLKWRYLVASPEETESLKALNSFEGKVTIVESEKDEIIPHQTIQNYIDAVSNPDQLTYIVMKDAPHGLPRQGDTHLREEFKQILLRQLS